MALTTPSMPVSASTRSTLSFVPLFHPSLLVRLTFPPSLPLPSPLPFRTLSSLQDGFGDVAFIGWVPLDLYRSSGSKQRSEKEVHKHWPVPGQPEEELTSANTLFREAKGDRLRIQI